MACEAGERARSQDERGLERVWTPAKRLSVLESPHWRHSAGPELRFQYSHANSARASATGDRAEDSRPGSDLPTADLEVPSPAEGTFPTGAAFTSDRVGPIAQTNGSCSWRRCHGSCSNNTIRYHPSSNTSDGDIAQPPFSTLQGVSEQFKSEFLPPDYGARILDELRARTQHRDDSLVEFPRALQTLYDRADPSASDSDKVSRAIRQTHGQFHPYLRGRVFQSLDELAISPPDPGGHPGRTKISTSSTAGGLPETPHPESVTQLPPELRSNAFDAEVSGTFAGTAPGGFPTATWETMQAANSRALSALGNHTVSVLQQSWPSLTSSPA
ncbi:hypothetical protein HPB47_024821 [Ixodes persulcatus]|uniref:Uncharacterized protein n=1 Tax=Ixodes persulcatus TaxID=34615 RepID=A0AC60Q538_IXOPE|nr:hypothetical protein HPB47_024821 [Ixodes persulcatus]